MILPVLLSQRESERKRGVRCMERERAIETEREKGKRESGEQGTGGEQEGVVTSREGE